MTIAKVASLTLLTIFVQLSLTAQDKLNIKFGKVSAEDFNIKSALIDSSTNAVVVADVGKSEFFANASELTFSLVFTQKKRIKIINKNGFDAATITIPLYTSDNKAEKLDDFDACTYNIEDGKVVKTRIDKSALLTEKQNKNWIYKKFTFPALKEGSIIEYSYQVKSDFFFNLQSWTFQGEYPVLWSQYEADIPEFFQFVILSQGYQTFAVNKTQQQTRSFAFVQHTTSSGVGAGGTGTRSAGGSAFNSFNVDGSSDYHTWIMKDIPPLKEEIFTTTLGNAIAKIEFQLNTVKYPNSFPKNYMDSWEKVATDLMEEESFGIPISRANNWLDNDVETIVGGATTPKDKARKIFDYVRDNLTCNNKMGIYTTGSLKDVLKNKNGSVADINLLLIAMLRNQKIDANPVILSTREHGFTHELYPLMNRYNYVIAKIALGEDAYYLDATTRQLAFSKLPSRVYNGQAREISTNMATPVWFVADSLTEGDITRAYISNLDNVGVGGSLTHYLGFYKSLDFRNKMGKMLPEDFNKTVRANYSEEVVIDNIQVDSLKLLENPVGIRYDMEFKLFKDEDIVYFNPILGDGLKKNPFTAANRFYPVEMPYKVDDTYTLTMEIPKGYKIEELPKSVRINFNEDEGMFEYLISADASYINMRCRLLLKRANYLNEDYQSLRDFYSFAVKKEAEQIVFKKIK